MHDTKSNNTVRRGPNFAHADVMRSNEQKGAEVERLIATLRDIKHVALTAGAPGELTVPLGLSRIVRLCIDAGAK